MDLSGISALLEQSPALQPLFACLDAEAGRMRVGLTEGAKATVIAVLARRTTGPVIVLVPRPHQAQALAEELTTWVGKDHLVLLFPERDLAPYRMTEPDPLTIQQRLQVLERLQGNEAAIIVSSGLALAQPTLKPEPLGSTTEIVRQGQRLDLAPFLARLAARGYEFRTAVDRPGSAARRGGIIDLFPPSAELPVRLELWGNEVESLRLFDPKTQRSVHRVEQVRVGPALELVPDAVAVQRLAADLVWSRVDNEVRDRLETALTLLASGQLPSREALAFFGPLVTRTTLLDHLPNGSLLVVDEPGEISQALTELENQAVTLRQVSAESGELPAGLPLPFLSWPDLAARLEAHPRRLDLSRWTSGEETASVRLPFQAAPAFGGRLRALVNQAAAAIAAGERFIFITQQAPRLAELLADQDLPSAVLHEVTTVPSNIALVHGSLPHGWKLPDDQQPLTVLSDAEIFGFVKQRRPVRPVAAGRKSFLSELTPGDYVVHIEHGIAKFAGLVRRSIDGVEREYFELHYAENDRLFVPTDQIDRISRYVGPSDHVPILTRLSSGEWARTKERVRRAVTELARELLELYAAREVARGHAFSPDTGWQMEMEAAFPYVETPDQLAAVQEVKGDMERPRPMDRLICGDVGYGKTEVAIRAAFKAVMDGKQVAVLVPTTVLAQQHEQTFKERLGAFPVRIAVLSRFRSEREQRQIIADLAQGSVDVVIGTHRLLQQDVRFRDLGLVIIDEEQRFGVAHKERLKQMRREVDVLTLSATPIPRTLQMSLGGIRDMSVMETPPEERLPITTYVTEFDARLVREAILREIDRGGQVYFVHNRVQDIELVSRRLRDLVPEAEFAVGHGQMDEDELERVMLDFAAGRYDVLICTTIIESGLDIPNVNTIIIDQADKLGLAQLYQLRGRVGRGASRAYAYLLYDKNRVLSETAQKRLQTIFEANELGAGFQIALRDLEIRGAGNLLGAEQSGHIGAVGFDLYTRLLAEAVERLRALLRGDTPPQPRADQAALSIDLPLTAFIPETYVADVSQRLALYERLAGLTRMSDVEEVAQELRDRFGPPPAPTANLLYVVRLRVLGQAARVRALATEGDSIVVHLGDDVRLNREAVQRRLPEGVRVTANQIRIDRRRHAERWRQMLETLLHRLSEFETLPRASPPRERLGTR